MGNQRGQAAIFVALMFNVLFVFFAMSINVALVVHDKINLQNSIDMAAYYAATKQAEMLNAIAHENYMIRQSYKLLAWRYRVLGTMGFYKAPTPVHPTRTGETSDTLYKPAERPGVCVVYRPNWTDVPIDESLCNTQNLHIPALPQVKVIAGFLGINTAIAELSKQLRLQFQNQCANYAAYNWWFGMSILHAFRLDQRNRNQVITALAKNLSQDSGDGDFLDLDGSSVLQGARETFYKNLTYSNRTSFDATGRDFKMINSLAGIDPKKWLPKIEIVPTLLFNDVEDGDSCKAVLKPISELPTPQDSKKFLNAPAPKGLEAGNLIQWRQERFLAESDYQFTIGVEKNPWFMAYMGVKATATPRQIFFPFGKGVPMVARGFAKPFGGRIGPWYQAKWDRGANNSDGDLTDPMMAPRMVNGGLTNDPNDPRRLPNYSRYPGDKLGITSKLAQNGLNGLAKVAIAYDNYKNIKEEMVSGSSGDILAWDFQKNTAPDIRNYEIAALAPDLFDITYYSIEPNFSKNYFERIRDNKSKFGIPGDTILRPDLGFSPTQELFSVQEQMELAKKKDYPRNEAFYFIRDKVHLLTSWLPGAGTYNYDVSASMENFGKCKVSDEGMKFPNPGSCVAGGGRTGYSVKLIGRDALLSDQHKIGGPSAAPGPILNPPKSEDGW